MKYRKKPVVIEAFKWTGDNNQVEDPKWIVEAMENGAVSFKRLYYSDKGEISGAVKINTVKSEVFMVIKTLEGEMNAQPGDYIIQGVQGEIYPCKPDIFEATYEAVENASLTLDSVE